MQANNVSTRPTVYTPYQEEKDMDLKKLSKLNRKTYKNYNVEGVSPEQLVALTKRPFEYDEILNSKEKTVNED